MCSDGAAGAVVEEFVFAFDEHPLTRARTAVADSVTRRLVPWHGGTVETKESCSRAQNCPNRAALSSARRERDGSSALRHHPSADARVVLFDNSVTGLDSVDRVSAIENTTLVRLTQVRRVQALGSCLRWPRVRGHVAPSTARQPVGCEIW